MIVCKCAQKFRDKQGNIVGYCLKDNKGATRDVEAAILKQLIKKGEITVSNLRLTSDNRLIDAAKEKETTVKEKEIATKQNVKGDVPQLTNVLKHFGWIDTTNEEYSKKLIDRIRQEEERQYYPDKYTAFTYKFGKCGVLDWGVMWRAHAESLYELGSEEANLLMATKNGRTVFTCLAKKVTICGKKVDLGDLIYRTRDAKSRLLDLKCDDTLEIARVWDYEQYLFIEEANGYKPVGNPTDGYICEDTVLIPLNAAVVTNREATADGLYEYYDYFVSPLIVSYYHPKTGKVIIVSFEGMALKKEDGEIYNELFSACYEDGETDVKISRALITMDGLEREVCSLCIMDVININNIKEKLNKEYEVYNLLEDEPETSKKVTLREILTGKK